MYKIKFSFLEQFCLLTEPAFNAACHTTINLHLKIKYLESQH